METGCVIDMVMGGTGIAELNAMQRAMAEDCSRRVVLVAPTGSGKTVAFVIRMLREVVPGRSGVQAVVVVPTRELARQVAGVVRGILNFEGGILNFGDSSAYASARGCNSGEGVNRRDADALSEGSEGPARLRCASAYGVTNNRRPADACGGACGTRLETGGAMGDGDGARDGGDCGGEGGTRLETGATMGDGGGMRCVCLYGGHEMRTEVGELEGAVAAGAAVVVVATPGRLVDHLNRGSVDLSGVRVAVVDEFDKCLELGFREEMERILNFEGGMGSFGRNGGSGGNGGNGTDRTNGARRGNGVPAGACVVLTSATGVGEGGILNFEGGILNFGDSSAYASARGCNSGSGTGCGGWRVYEFGAGETAPVGEVEVTRVMAEDGDKDGALVGLLRSVAGVCGRVIVFVNQRVDAERVWRLLRGEGVAAVLYHGGMDQQRRRMAVEMLANGSARVMVATDLAARGLDIEGVDAVVHYDEPEDVETWTHRNGRTGRQGASGRVYVILNFEGGILNFGDSSAYASARGCNSGEGVNRRDADALSEGSESPARLRCASAYGVTNNRRPADACAGGGGTRLETAATMGDGGGVGAAGGCVDGCGMRLETGDNMGDGGGVAKVGLNGGGTPPPLRCTLYINAGRKEKISRGDVAGYVMKQGGLAREEVGRIAVEDHYAMVAVPAERGEELARVLSGRKIKGVRVKVSVISN